MTLLNDLPFARLKFYVTTQYPCGYLPDQQARSLVAAPAQLIDTATYGELVKQGFRRSGLYTYRPHCENCQSCVPVRLRVNDFHPTRSQRRAWKHHENLIALMRPLEFSEEHFELYSAYQKTRHAGGGMDTDNAEQYRSFLMQSGIDSAMIEFRENGVLRMVSIVDRLPDGLSAVYAFYDSSIPGASYGTYNVLWLTQWCRQQNRPYLYLGYWIEQSRKMSYKIEFQPLEKLVGMHWRELPRTP
ncbi:arginine-tRNA-protein transferase [Novimethylophilus kurashikiensis]|uniref:Aspartate/glutamate leucyltransferase n=1 Tax=Novimethylophilus kurashikiensis TaxID=1825523 RepID=A0A2R5F291_9PROT|nr:arginyltransferase [Novimethylophilus kurashikiensis]GBG12746.1 arginine-tRNA-protein transferase [Novimethylophilus kurashikiensis]